MSAYTFIDIPFNFRHTCWFCGEPASHSFDFPKNPNNLRFLEHPPMSIPACSECAIVNVASDVSSIWAVRDHVKRSIMDKYADHLAIGQNWTEEELKESEFSGALLGGFGESAWTMYLIAKDRLSYQGWTVSIDSMLVEWEDESYGFEFDGVRYMSLNTCLEHLIKALRLDAQLLPSLIDILGPERLDYALRIAKLNKAITTFQREKILDEIRQQQDDKQDIAQQAKFAGDFSQVEEVAVGDGVATVESIQWALKNRITTLDHLCREEDAFFDEFAHLGGPQCYMNYYGLQLYFEARQNLAWIAENDPNIEWW
ncbi:hypothetical protein [Vibrio rumoiensis]|uniref:Uncharacterized protein n=1 Tax=Vibrio rumoiensis 1S-45 TaxID=1188252 RepID=A0A1E5E3F4_9VIBR|nr:hypothetical protein [Vibrio rumoiensis]OEF26825.1 hypothetical protein A1QC_15250 [Vibrio rumoiensis 1S-45]